MEDLLAQLPPKFRPKLLLKGNLTQPGSRIHGLDDLIPVFAIWEHIIQLFNEHGSVIYQLKALTGSGKSLCLSQFGIAAFNNAVNIILSEPLVNVVTDIVEKTSIFYKNLVLGQTLGYKTKPKKLIKSGEFGLDVVTTGVGYQLLTTIDFIDQNTNRLANIFILDEVHLRESSFIYSCLDLMIKKIATGEKILVILTSANIERELISEYIITSLEANARISLNKDKYQNATSDICGYYGLAPLNESQADVIGSGNQSFRIESFLSVDVPNYLEVILDLIIKTKFNQKSTEYKWIGGNSGHVLIFMEGARPIKLAAAYLEKNLDKIPRAIILRSTSKTHRAVSDNMHLVNSPNVNGDLYILSTNVLSVGATVDDLRVVFDTGFNFGEVKVPLMRDSTVLLKPPTKSNCIQKIGRAGRGIRGVAFTLMTKETYEMLPYNIGSLTYADLDFLILTKCDTNSSEIKNQLFTGMDPICFQNAIDSLQKLTYWNAIESDTFKTTYIGKTLLKLTTTKMTVRDSMCILLCKRFQFPIKLCVLISLLLARYKSGARMKLDKLKTLDDSFEVVIDAAIDFYTADAVYDDEIFSSYEDVITKLAQIDIDTSYKFKSLLRPKIQRDKLFKSAKEIFAIAYCNFLLTFDQQRKQVKMTNGVSFKYDTLKSNHLGVKWERKELDANTKIFATGTGKISTKSGGSFIVPTSIFVLE